MVDCPLATLAHLHSNNMTSLLRHAFRSGHTTATRLSMVTDLADYILSDRTFLTRMASAYLTGPEIRLTTDMVKEFHLWLKVEASKVGTVRYVNQNVDLSEATTAYLNGEIMPVSILGTEAVSDLMTREQNLEFRAAHDRMHAIMEADAGLRGELIVTLAHVMTAPESIWSILASEVIGQAAVTISSGSFPKQRLSAACINLLL